MEGPLSWNWILWIGAILVAVASLVRLSITLRDRLQTKLDDYFKTQLTDLVKKRRHLRDLRYRVDVAKKLLDERKAMESEVG
jgi:hypothetical protein